MDGIRIGLEKVIESLFVQFIDLEHLKIVKPVTIKNAYCGQNRLFVVDKGRVTFSFSAANNPLFRQRLSLSRDKLLFCPAGTHVDIEYGSASVESLNDNDEAIQDYLVPTDAGDVKSSVTGFVRILQFNVLTYNALDFFKFVQLPCFTIDNIGSIREAILFILREHYRYTIGQQKILDSNVQILTILCLRYIIDKKLFPQHLGSRIDALMDPRIVETFTYTESNLAGDLSNGALARHIKVSKDYFGQLFYKATGIHYQKYAKKARLRRAVELLTTTNKRVDQIHKEVGIQDFPYFCRIFKEIIGSSAKQVRHRFNPQLSREHSRRKLRQKLYKKTPDHTTS